MGIERSLKEVEVMALQLDPPVVMAAAATVREVIVELCQRGEGCALLTDSGYLVGIFTERDVLQKVLGITGALEQPVSALMTRDPVCVKRHDPIRFALFRIQQGGFRHLPIVDDEHRVVGCIRHKDLGRYVARHFPDRLLNLPPDPEQIARQPEGG